MKSDELLDAIGEAKDAYIQDVRNPQAKKTPGWAKWASAIAACLVLALGFRYVSRHMGGAAPSEGGGAGHENGSVFMSYAGPVFPLTLLEENDKISADRNITLDFAPWVPVWITNEQEAASLIDVSEEERRDALETYNKWYPEGGYYQTSSDIIVTDAYTLTNTDAENQTIRVLYPFASTLSELDENRPVLTAGDKKLDTDLHIGTYAGGFQGGWENWEETHENPGSLNLLGFDSWEDYQTLLSDGSYLQKALGGFTDLSHIPVTVYQLIDAWGPEENDDAGIPNPSIRVLFEMDYDKTKVISYNFNGGLHDRDKGVMGRSFSIREEWERGYGTPYYLIVIGDDIKNLSWQGYVTGGWDTKETIEAGVTVTRTESNLEEALREAAEYNYREMYEPQYDFELYYGLLKEHLVAYGVLSESTLERYDSGMVEELDVVGVGRVCWLEAELTIPAGESVTINATFEKEASFDYSCAGTENKGVSGYDMVTTLDSNLSFTKQTAQLEDRGQIEIVRQNFGFDLANGINQVTLDLSVPHYYLEVKEQKSS